MTRLPNVESISSTIHVIRGQRVMLDADLARLYGVKTERLNQQVRRNRDRFPADFMFQLTAAEWESGNLLQIAIGLRRTIEASKLPQFAGGFQKHRDLTHVVERQGGQLAGHDDTILKILAEIRRLTQFPEAPRRGIGFTAEWPEDE